jgi:uncharacterized protein YbjT (DUF2867 family)
VSDRRPILVTGATGNVGRPVVESLLSRGAAVRAAVRDPREAAPGVEPVSFDFLDRSTFAGAVRGARGLFLLRPPPIGDMKSTLIPLIDDALAAGAERIVFLSVAGADRMRWVPHHAVEAHLAKVPAKATILRPGFFAQNLGDAYRDDLRQRREIVVPAGRGKVAFVDVRDVGEVAARAFDDDRTTGEAFTLTGPEAIDFDAVARIVSGEIGAEIRYRPVGIFGYARHLRRHAHLRWAQIAIQTILHVGIRRGDAETVDPTLERLLGRRPRTLADYVRDHRALFDPIRQGT